MKAKKNLDISPAYLKLSETSLFLFSNIFKTYKGFLDNFQSLDIFLPTKM